MKRAPFVVGAALLAALAVTGCRCSRGASKGAPPAVTATVTRLDAPAPQVVSLTSRGGVTLEASQWTRGASTAPAIVLVHRLAGSRAEWGGLIPELFASPGDLTVLALDLRGHGGSRQKDPTGKLSGWRELGASDYAAMGDDVLAAVAHLRQGGVTRPVALVGSDLGATAVCLAGGKVGAGLAGIALVSPGGALRGVDLFEPFAQLKSHPVWLAVGQEDAVSLAATRTLEKMSPTAKLLVLPSSAHGAEALGAERPELWRSLAEFLRALKS